MANFVFFLGGSDAEMIEIRGLLDSEDQTVIDHGLTWQNARLSKYEAEIAALSPDQVPVFIELKIDITPPENAVLIDHHNEKAGKDQSTSIEQIAELLGVELNRWQQLVSANDRGYIQGMREMGASNEEINEVRAFDRKAQRVTPEDERLAAESIKYNLQILPAKTALVYSRTNRTSTIFDRIHDQYNRIFVLTPDGQMSYAGKGDIIEKLIERYEHYKREHPRLDYWFGGGLPENGFFGASEPLEKEEIIEMLKTKVHSHHIFLFPFTLSKRTPSGNPKDFMEDVSNALTDTGWEPSPFNPTDANLKYGEYFYFHHFAREAIFSHSSSEDNPFPLMRYFIRPEAEGGSFHIILKEKNKEFLLDVHQIALRMYDSRIGILSFELFNHKYPDLKDIIRINDTGRRIYPQFLGEINGVEDTKAAFLPKSVTLKLGNTPYLEDFCETRFKQSHQVTAKYIEELLGEHFTANPKDYSEGKSRFLYKPTIDDRMYVVCWYGSDEWSNIIKSQSDMGEHAYVSSTDWYQFVFFDGGFPNCQHEGMRKRLIHESTYERWADFGTLYGITRYGLVCLTNSEDFGYDIIRNHMRKQYAQMAALLLAQRASILRFSEAVTGISKQIKALGLKRRADEKAEVDAIAKDIERLHADYIRFVNRLWFTEITPQEQGIEMYTQAGRIMDLKENMQDLKSEIKELYEFISNFQDRTANRQMNNLTILGSIFLPLVVLTGFFGMNLFFIDTTHSLPGGDVITHIGSAVHLFLSILVFIISFFLLIRIVRGVIKNLDGEDSNMEKYLTFKHWWNALRGKPAK